MRTNFLQILKFAKLIDEKHYQLKRECENLRKYNIDVASQTCMISSNIFKIGRELDIAVGNYINARANYYGHKIEDPLC